jgi:DNA-binding CsgD family transcriptional regulator
MRWIGRPDNPDLHFGGAAATELAGHREAAHVPMKLFVIDRKVALFPVNPADPEQGYLEVSQEPIVQSLVTTFERHWAEAHDPTKDAMPPFTLSPREQAVIALLTSGHTDAGTARELRISERSVSGIVRSIMDRLGVDNRFQLGVALGTLNAAPVPPGLTVAIDRPETPE